MKPICVGIVGSGFVAELHMRAYRRVFGLLATIKAVVSRGDHVLEFAKRFGIPEKNITVLSEAEGEKDPSKRPTRQNIEREFRRLAKEAKPNDQVVITLSGHGTQQPVIVPPTSNVDRSSGMADKAKDVNPFKNVTRPQPSVAPNAPNAQPVVPLNDFTGG